MKILCLLLTILLPITLSGCNKLKPSADGKLRVVATTSMIGDVARAIGGNDVSVEALMGPGIDPHLYKASEGDLRRIENAQVLLYNGLHLEARMAEVFSQMQKSGRRAVAVAEAIPKEKLMAPPEFEGQFDPHVWFDVSLWKITCAEVTRALAEAAPEKAESIRQRGAVYDASLDALDAHIKAQVGTIPEARRVLITAHDAFNYFGRAYGFEVRGLQGISTASEAGARDVDTMAAFIAERKLPAIFVESSVPPRTIQALQEAVRARGQEVQIGGELYSDALGDPATTAGTYLGMFKHNVDTITHALTNPSATAGE